MKVLLIGGTGVLSYDILLQCLNQKYDTYVLNRGHHNSIIPKNATIIEANIRNKDEVDKAIGCRKFDVIVDFLSLKPLELKSSFEFFQDKCKQYVFISSACAFRRATEDGILTEDSPKPNINLPYSVQKYQSEQYLINAAVNAACKYTIIRPYITYGDTRIPFGIAPLARYHWTMAARILNEKPFFIWDDGKAICTLTHTKDFAYNIIQLFDNENALNEDFNVVGDEHYTWAEMLNLLYRTLGKDPNYISLPTSVIAKQLPSYKEFLIGDRSLNAIFDNSKLKRTIPDFQQKISLEEGLKRTINYYKNYSYLSGIDYKYDACIDKLISKYSNNNLHFIDYLHNSTLREKIEYTLYRHFDYSFVTYLGKLQKIPNKIKRYFIYM